MADNYKKGKSVISSHQSASDKGSLLLHLDQLEPPLPGNPSDSSITPVEVAEYSAEILEQLHQLAQGAGHTFLAYLLQVAMEEAKIRANGEDNV